MHTLTASATLTDAGSGQRVELSPVERLHALDDLLHGLWAHEPDARFGERHQRLNTLRQLTIEVERLAFRQSFHPDEHHLGQGGADLAALDDCTRRAADLLSNWSKDLWAGDTWPTEVLGERNTEQTT